MSTVPPNPAETPGSADLSGRQVGDFQLLRRLGCGAMAEVYLAEQYQLKRRVAVKILRPELAQDQTYLRRFEREAQAAASLVHANIVQIHEVGHVDGLHYIVQEYVQGQNLRDWLGRNGPPGLPAALSIMRQVTAALAKAAEMGVVHRDIKPENIMITASGEVKVADFGLARVTRQTDVSDLTQVGITMGTPLYMSPEQVEGRPLDPRSDIYSLGVTSYHMLTGEPPFVGDTALVVAVQHLKREPKPLEVLRPDLPPALCRIVHKMLAKDPQRRWQSAQELLGQLRCVYMEHCSQSAPDLDQWQAVPLEPLAQRQMETTRQLDGLMKSAAMQRLGRRGRLALAGGLAACLLLGGGIAWLTTRERPLLAATAPGKGRTPRQDTALRQVCYAIQIGTEEAWRSVVEYHNTKENEYLVRRAKQQLGRIYLRRGDYARALPVFDDLAAAGDADKEFRAFGLAGKAAVLNLQGKYQDSAAVVDKLWDSRSDLRDEPMKRLLDDVIKKNGAELGVAPAKDWDKWLKEQFHPEG